MKPWAFLSVLLLCSTGALAQDKNLKISHIIHPKKVYMKTPGNRDKDSLIIPIVSDKYPALGKALSEDSLFNGAKLDSIIKEYQEDGHGITSLSYKVTYLDKHIISIILNYETMGAYPDSYQTWLTLNIHTGKPYPLSNEVTSAGLNYIFTKYKQALNKQLIRAKAEIKEDKELSEDDINDIVNTLKTSTDKLIPSDLFNQILFTTKGLKLTSDNVLPHVFRNCDLGRDWFVPYAKLRQFKKPGALVIK